MATEVIPRAEARPMSKEEYDAWMVQSATIQTKIKGALRKGRAAMWELAEQLYLFEEAQAWRALGYETLGEWLADPDITMRKTTYYDAVSAWEQMHVIRKVPAERLNELDVSKLRVALPVLKRGEASLDDVMADAEVLGIRDMRIKYQEHAEPELVPDEDVVPMPDDSENAN